MSLNESTRGLSRPLFPGRSALRNWLRHAALDVASCYRSAVMGDRQLRQAQALQIVLLHRVQPQEEPRFTQMLHWLQQNYELVAYGEACQRLAEGTPGKRPLATLSFDDGLADNFRAAQIMSEMGVAGCFFVCPGIIGERRPAEIERFCRERMLFDQVESFLGWDQLEAMRGMGHEIGNHSWSHFYMHELSDQQFEDEVAGARSEIQRRLGECRHFAWPYGRFIHFREARVSRVLKMGHASCASGERGAHVLSEHPANTNENATAAFCLRRDSIDLQWPWRHCRYFLERSTSRAIPPECGWPRARLNPAEGKVDA